MGYISGEFVTVKALYFKSKKEEIEVRYEAEYVIIKLQFTFLEPLQVRTLGELQLLLKASWESLNYG